MRCRAPTVVDRPRWRHRLSAGAVISNRKGRRKNKADETRAQQMDLSFGLLRDTLQRRLFSSREPFSFPLWIALKRFAELRISS